MLYKRGHFIESANSFFIIEISSNAESALIIAAYDIQTGSSLLMQQKPDQARKTLVQFNGDLKQVAEAVQVCEDGRSLKLVKGPKRDRQRALFSQDASMAHTMNKTTPTHMGAFLDSP